MTIEERNDNNMGEQIRRQDQTEIQGDNHLFLVPVVLCGMSADHFVEEKLGGIGQKHAGKRRSAFPQGNIFSRDGH